MIRINKCNIGLWVGIFTTGSLLLHIYPSLSSDEVVDGTTTRKINFQRSPIELHDIGYHGTWDQFCDRDSIDEDFAYYPLHELKLLRLVICDRKEQKQINCHSMGPFVAYKYCEMMRTQADDFLQKLIARFSEEDEKKEATLLTPDRPAHETDCYQTTWRFFNDTCVDEKNPYFRMYLPLLARACLAEWLTTDIIQSHIKEVCSGNKRLHADIEWYPIAASINCRE